MDPELTPRCRYCGERWNILVAADHDCEARRQRLVLVANTCAPSPQAHSRHPHDKLRRKLKASRPTTD